LFSLYCVQMYQYLHTIYTLIISHYNYIIKYWKQLEQLYRASTVYIFKTYPILHPTREGTSFVHAADGRRNWTSRGTILLTDQWSLKHLRWPIVTSCSRTKNNALYSASEVICVWNARTRVSFGRATGFFSRGPEYKGFHF